MSADTDLSAYVTAVENFDTALIAAGAALTTALAAEQTMNSSQAAASLSPRHFNLREKLADQLKKQGLDAVGTKRTGIPVLTTQVDAWAAAIRAVNASY